MFSAYQPTSKLDDHLLSAVHDFLYVVTLYFEGRSLYPQYEDVSCLGYKDRLNEG
jgi:hypothetical protein